MIIGSSEWTSYIKRNRAKYFEYSAIQDKELSRLYIEFAGNLKKEANRIIDKATWTYSQKRLAIRELIKEADKLSGGFKHILDKAMIDFADLGTDVDRVMLKKYSQSLAGAGVDINMERVLFKVPTNAVKVVQQRIWEDGLKLSDRIWILDRRTKREIERIVLEEIATGRPASDKFLDARLNKLLNPDRRVIRTKLHGRNVSFDGARLLRTERANAFIEADRMATKDNLGARGIKWMRSSHPGPCPTGVCEDYSRHDEGLGIGVYSADNLPITPHPQCKCYTVTVAMSSEQMTRNWVEWMNDKSIHPEISQWFNGVYKKAA